MKFTIVEINRLSQALQVVVLIEGIPTRQSFYIPAEDLFCSTLETQLRQRIKIIVNFNDLDYSAYVNKTFAVYEQGKQQAFG